MKRQRPQAEAFEPIVDDASGVDDAGARRAAAQGRALPGPWRRADRVLVAGTEYGLFAIGVMFTVMITLEVLSRYLLNFSIYFVNAAARLLLVWFFLLGAGLALRHGAHVGFELLIAHLRPRARRIVVLVGLLLILLFAAEMVWAGFYSVTPALNQVEAGLGISLVWAVVAVPVGFALVVYHTAVLVWGELRSGGPAP
jgi:TRAP-type C4-dicarboxylate transport system permease small subunit